MTRRATIQRLLKLAALCGVVASSACGGCGEDERPGQNGDRPVFNNAASLPTSSFGDQLGPSSNDAFEFSPGEPGTMTGLRARVTLDGGGELVSNQVELTLRSPEQIVQDADGVETTETETRSRALTRIAQALEHGASPDPEGPDPEVVASALQLDFARTFGMIAADLERPQAFSATFAIGSPDDPDDDGVPNSGDVLCTGADTDPMGCEDNCPFVENTAQFDEDGNGIGDACEDDFDGDGRPDDGDASGVAGDNPCTGPTDTECDDNAPAAPNPRQPDRDSDGIGDVSDPDADGDGMPDADESGEDTDGDGISNGEEGTGDTDGDGIPDYADPDDDGDGIPTSDEAGGDSDGDGVPDDRDTDSDGDGVPDSFEGPRDTDGDGTPDWRDDDDDGDGIPTSAERNGDEDGDGIPDRLDDTNDDECERYPVRTQDFDTIDGTYLQFDFTGSFGFLGLSTDYIWVFNVNREGGYFSLQVGESINFPPDFAAAGVGVGLSVFAERLNFQGTTFDYYGDLDAITLSVDFPALLTVPAFFAGAALFADKVPPQVLPLSVPTLLGTTFSVSIIRHQRVPVGVRIGIGSGISASLFGPISPAFDALLPNVGLAYSTSFMKPEFFLRVLSFDDCKNIPGAQRQPLNATLGDAIATTVRARSEEPPATSLQAKQAALSAASLPLVEVFEGSTGLAPARHIPAGSNADLFADFVARGPVCDGCPDTSLTYLITEGYRSLQRAGGEEGALVPASLSLASKFMEVIPDPLQLMQAAFSIRPMLEMATLTAFQVSADSRGDAFRFIDERVIEIPAPLGERVDVTYTLAELSALTGFPEDALLNTHVCLEGVLQISDASCFFMEGPTATVGFTLGDARRATMSASADLTTAVGPFDGQQVGRWAVGFATRVLVPVPDEPIAVGLTGPPGLIAGAPATLNAVLFDEHLMTPTEATGTVAFLDAEDNVLAEVPLERGRASFQFVPTPTAPTLESVELGEVPMADGSMRPGIILRGRGFSGFARVLIDGEDIRSIPSDADPEIASYAVSASSHDVIFIITQDPQNLVREFTRSFTVVNPNDRRSGDVSAR